MEIHKHICYESLTQRYGAERVDELVNLILEVLCAKDSTIKIAGKSEPAELVQDRFRRLNSFHVEYVLSALESRAPGIRRIKGYLLACLFNAVSTMNNDLSIQSERDRREYNELMDALVEI